MSAKTLPIWKWEKSGTCTLDAALLVSFIFVLAHKITMPEVVGENSTLQTSPFFFFASKVEEILKNHSSWDNVSPKELTDLRNLVRDELDSRGIQTNHKSYLDNAV